MSAEYESYVDALAVEGNLVHLTVRPVRDPECNRLRELNADKTTYEVTRVIAHDRLYINKHIYDTTFDIRVGVLADRPIVTSIHGEIGQAADGSQYVGDGKSVDYTFTNIGFSTEMPDWYFNAHN